MSRVEKGDGWELRLGRWQDVIADVECDAVITDPPYSERTAKGQRSHGANDEAGFYGNISSAITYGHVTRECCESIAVFAERATRWIVGFGDHITVAWMLEALSERGLYTFAPNVWTKPDAAPRFLADGPSPTTEQFAVARPRRRLERIEKRYRPGHYHYASRHHDRVVTGGKPMPLMRRVVRDYSEPGDVIVDLYAGGGTTLLAAVTEGRRAIGAEVDPDTFDLAVKRLRKGHTRTLFTEAPKVAPAETGDLFGGDS